jgi:FAD:protein FMN transferase
VKPAVGAAFLAAIVAGGTLSSQQPTRNFQMADVGAGFSRPDCRPPSAACQLVIRDAYLMGTRVHLATYAAERTQGMVSLDTALRVLESAERELSTWRRDSDISRLNRHPMGEPWQAPASTCRVLESVFAWQRDTGGAFDPGIGRLIEAWNIHGEGRVPSSGQLHDAAARSGLSLLSFDRKRCVVTRRGDATIDVGAFGKGAALDRVEAALGPGAWLVDLGGQVTIGGPDPDGRPWIVDIAHPRARDVAYLHVALREGSLSTSGSSERDLLVNGTRVGHILDPRTGKPATFRGSVTVWHRESFAADALSTGLYVMGPEDGLRWADARSIAAVFLIPDGNEVKTFPTAAWRKRGG